MSIVLNDNIDVRASKPADARFGVNILGTTGFYTTTSAANAAIPTYQRYIGLTVGIKSGAGPIVEYWYANGIANIDLVEKVGSVVSASNGLTVISGSVGLGGSLTQPTTITTNSTNTLTLSGLTTNNAPTNILITNGSGVVQQATYSTLVTSISNTTLGNLTASNGLSKSGTNVKLGGSTLTEITTVNLGDFPLIFQNKLVASTVQSEFTFTKSLAALDTFDNISLNPGGSRSRVISFRSSTAMWTTNYEYNSVANPAYNAFSYWLANVKPWIPAEFPSGYPSGVPFQILENMLGTNTGSALQAHYFDERVSKPQWSDTWTDATTPNPLGSVFPGWILGKTYTIRDYVAGDDFTGTYSSIRSGVLNTTGFTFVSNGSAPVDWTNGSTIDGDFPITELNDRTSYITTTEEDNPSDPFYQKGIVRIESNATYINGYVDQGTSTRGFRLSQTSGTNTATLPTDATVGEMFYSTGLSKVVVRTALVGVNQWISLDSTAI